MFIRYQRPAVSVVMLQYRQNQQNGHRKINSGHIEGE